MALSRGIACRATTCALAACKRLFQTAFVQLTPCSSSSPLAGEALLVPALWAAQPAFPGAHLAPASIEVSLHWLGSAFHVITPGKLSLMNPSWETVWGDLFNCWYVFFCSAVHPPFPIPLGALASRRGWRAARTPAWPLLLGVVPTGSPGTPGVLPAVRLSQLARSLHSEAAGSASSIPDHPERG